MNFLCPSCRTPLPRLEALGLVTCTQCAVQVDLTRVDTAPGQARLWPEVDLKGETLSGHLLVSRLGSGGMGTVYEAESAVGTVVAMKVLSPMLAAEPALRERFRREARAMTKVQHPRVVRLFEEGEDRGFCWYSMERVKGLDLRSRLIKGPMTAVEVDALAVALLDALDGIHQAGIVHRDLKPANILMGPEGPRVCDFGIAQVSGATTLTESAALLGSLRYMAPEQRWGKADERSDLYALGVVLHEALAGGVPGEQPLPSSVPTYLSRFIGQLTQADAAARPPTALEATRRLKRLRSGALKKVAAGLGLVTALVAAGVGATFFGSESVPAGATVSAVVDAGAVATAQADGPDAAVVEDAGVALAVADVADAGDEVAVTEVRIGPSTGALVLAARGTKQAEVDGKSQLISAEPMTLPAGKHTVRFLCPSGKVPGGSPRFDVEVVADGVAKVSWDCATKKPLPEAPSKVVSLGSKVSPFDAVPTKGPKPSKKKPALKKPGAR